MNYLPIFTNQEDSQIKYLFTNVQSDFEPLTVNEDRQVEGFSRHRFVEFSIGRTLAKKALVYLDSEILEIPRGTDGEPIWPRGFTGSISHCKSIIGAAVSRKNSIQSIGIDIEEIGRVTKDMWDSIFTEQEQLFLKSLDIKEHPKYTVLLFSLKESY